MPVHLTRLNGKMILRCKVPAQGTNEDDEQEKYTDGDVETVKTGQCIESRAKGPVIHCKMIRDQIGVLVYLATQEYGA